MDVQLRVLVVVQAGTAHLLVAQVKTQGLDQMQLTARVGRQADHVAGVGRNFRLNQDDVKHVLDSLRHQSALGGRSDGVHRCGQKPPP